MLPRDVLEALRSEVKRKLPGATLTRVDPPSSRVDPPVVLMWVGRLSGDPSILIIVDLDELSGQTSPPSLDDIHERARRLGRLRHFHLSVIAYSCLYSDAVKLARLISPIRGWVLDPRVLGLRLIVISPKGIRNVLGTLEYPLGDVVTPLVQYVRSGRRGEAAGPSPRPVLAELDRRERRIREELSALKRRFALGEVDLATYRRSREELEARLRVIEGARAAASLPDQELEVKIGELRERLSVLEELRSSGEMGEDEYAALSREISSALEALELLKEARSLDGRTVVYDSG